MKLSEIPEAPPPNGDKIQAYLVKSVAALMEDARKRSRFRFSKDITLGNLILIGGLVVSGLFAWFRGEAHIEDKAHIHWTSVELETAIDKRDLDTQKLMQSRIDGFEEYIRERAIITREFTDWKAATTERLRGLEAGQDSILRAVRNRNNLDDKP